MPNPLKIPYGPADIDPSGLPDISNKNWEAKAPAIAALIKAAPTGCQVQ